MASSKKQITREVIILARYTIKKDHTTQDGRTFQAGSLVLVIRNDQGVKYTVTLRRNGQHSCSCPAHSHHCYHLNHCREVENARVARENAIKRDAKRVQVDKATHRPFVTTSPATPDGLVPVGRVLTASLPCKGAVVATGAILAKMYAAPLTKNTGFSLLRI